jgi:DnaJ-class molecular chaperone
MIFILFRLLLISGLIAIVYLVVKSLVRPSDFIKCGRCEGKGFWYAARGKETCDWCKGSGKLPRNPEH